MSDVLIVGCGLAGAAIAQCAAAAGLHVTVLEGGLLGAVAPGRHVSADPRLTFASEARNRLIRGLLLPLETGADGASWARGAEFSVGIGAGGAGIIWTGIAERLQAFTPEGHAFLSVCVEPCYFEAERLLGVTEAANPPSAFGNAGSLSMRALRTATCREKGGVRVPGPIDFLAAGPVGLIDILHGRVAKFVMHAGGTATGVMALNIRTRELECLGAEVVVIAADAIRSPSLLAASRLRPEPGFPVGRWLTDHPLAVARVAVTTDEGRALASCLATPPGVTTCRGALLESGPSGAFRLIVDVPGADPLNRVLALYWYGVGNPDPRNALVFADLAESGFAAPGARVLLRVPMADAFILQALVDDLAHTAERFGKPLRGWKPRLLPLGSAMHVFGTLRTTLTSGEPGVTDIDGRVRGFRNLFAAGPSRLPAPSSTNPVLASVAAALHTAHAIIGTHPGPSEASPKAGGQTEPRD